MHLWHRVTHSCQDLNKGPKTFGSNLAKSALSIAKYACPCIGHQGVLTALATVLMSSLVQQVCHEDPGEE